MPPKPTVDREEILSAALRLVREQGLMYLNARSLADALGCSTKPLFRVFENMEDLRAQLRLELDLFYDRFMEERMDEKNRLLTQGIAYVEFARAEKNIFEALFASQTMAGKSLGDIMDAPWNQASIENARRVTGLSVEGARELFINIWLYSHGIASQLAANEIDLPPDRVTALMENAFRRFSATGEKIG